jgi:hypothetical protein
MLPARHEAARRPRFDRPTERKDGREGHELKVNGVTIGKNGQPHVICAQDMIRIVRKADRESSDEEHSREREEI